MSALNGALVYKCPSIHNTAHAIFRAKRQGHQTVPMPVLAARAREVPEGTATGKLAFGSK